MTLLCPLLKAAFPTASKSGIRILEAIAVTQGEVAPAEVFAHRLGYANRHQLARELDHAGLPVFTQVKDWTRILSWVLRGEVYGESLCGGALETARYPSARYRLVKRVTGRTWSEVRARGSEWLVATIRERYGYGVLEDGAAPSGSSTGEAVQRKQAFRVSRSRVQRRVPPLTVGASP